MHKGPTLEFSLICREVFRPATVHVPSACALRVRPVWRHNEIKKQNSQKEIRMNLKRKKRAKGRYDINNIEASLVVLLLEKIMCVLTALLFL